jgi:hypothetical protein
LVGSNVFNLAAMIGLSALLAGSVWLPREVLPLEGFVGGAITSGHNQLRPRPRGEPPVARIVFGLGLSLGCCEPARLAAPPRERHQPSIPSGA